MYRNVLHNGKPLHYHCVGTGPAVVLLHGFAEDSTIWGFQKDALQQHFQLLIPDLLGSRQSPLVADMSMENLAAAVHAMLQQESIERCVIIGHSMGGYIALAFAETYGTVVQGIGLFHSSAFADTPEKIETRQKAIAFMTAHGAHNFLKTAIPNLYSAATKETTPALIEAQVKAAQPFSKETLIANYEAMIQRPDRTDVLRKLNVPVLFVFGKWDTAVPLQSGLAQCYLPQLAYIHVLARSGHMGMAEEPEQSQAILNHYLSETAGLL